MPTPTSIKPISLMALSCPTFISVCTHRTTSEAIVIGNSGARPVLIQLKTPIQFRRPSFNSLSLSTENSFPSSCRRFPLVPRAIKNTGEEEEDHTSLPSHFKRLYHVLGKRSVLRLLYVMRKGYNYICDSQGKKQVLDLFISLIKSFQSHMEFIIQPTLDGRLNIGVQWKLAWEKSHEPLGKGYSFYMSHLYQGRMIISNVQILLGPLMIFIEPLRLKVMGLLMHVVEKFHPKSDNNGAKESMYYCLSLFTFVIFYKLFGNAF